MKTDANRPWRKSHLWTTLLLVVATLALGVAPTQAETGGISTTAPGESQAGADSAFAPMRWAGATWYGPGLYGRHTACGQLLTADTLGVAHRSLPCGTTVKFVYHGRSVVTQVIDRGPYSHGNSWDLTLAAAEALDFDEAGADQIGYAVALGEARKPSRAGDSAR
jgi:rare lipoprotein A